MRKDTQLRHDHLCNLIQEHVASDGQEFEGYEWIICSRAYWATRLGVSTRTISRLIKTPPIQTRDTMVEGKRVVLLRVGEPGKKSAKHLANIMAKDFRKRTGSKEIPDAQWGMLIGLAESWPSGYQEHIFRHVISPDGWRSFSAALNLHISFEQEANGQKNLKKRFLRHPSISVLRRFFTVAADSYKTDMQGSDSSSDPDFPFFHYH